MQIEDTGLIANDDFEVTILLKVFSHYSQYQEGITSSAGGRVISGGGTRTSRLLTYGYAIKIKNNADANRDFRLECTLFKDVANKVVERKISKWLSNVKPGYTEIIEIDLCGDQQRNLYLDEIIVTDPSRNIPDQRFPQFCRMHTIGEKNITPAELRAAESVKSFGLFLKYVIYAFGIGIVCLIGYAMISIGQEKVEYKKREDEYNRQVQNQSVIRNRMNGNWKCRSDVDGNYPDPISINGNEMRQGTTTVQLDHQSGIRINGNRLERTETSNSASYGSRNTGSAFQLTLISPNVLTLQLFAPQRGSNGFNKQTFTCSKKS